MQYLLGAVIIRLLFITDAAFVTQVVYVQRSLGFDTAL